MNIHKAFRFRLYPNQDQTRLIDKTIGCTRFVYNFFLAKQKEKEKYWHLVNEMVQSGQLSSNEWKGDYFNKNRTIKALPQLKEQYPFLKEVDSIALQKTVENLHNAYQRYYNKQNNEPRFKSADHKYQSYTTKMTKGNIAVYDRYIKLPKLGLVKFANSQKVEGRIMSATIRKKQSGKYYISISVEMNLELPKKEDSIIATYIGCKEIASICGDGILNNQDKIQQLHDRLLVEQQQIARKKPGSNNWEKHVRKIARITEKITNIRKDRLNKLTTFIVQHFHVIALDERIGTFKLQSADGDMSWHLFHTMLTYKAKWQGCQLVNVPNANAFLHTCVQCHFVKKEHLHKDQYWLCPSCQTQYQPIEAIKDYALTHLTFNSAS